MTKVFALSVLLATTTAVQAESLEERTYWKRQQKFVDLKAADAGKKCGTEFTVEFLDKPNFRAETEKTRHAPNEVCESLIWQVLLVCKEGEDEAAAMRSKVKKIQCGYAADRTLDIKKGTLIFRGNHVQKSFGEWAKPALMKKL